MPAPYSRPTLLIDGVDYTDYLVPESFAFQSVVKQGVEFYTTYALKNPAGTFPVEGGKVVQFYLANKTTPLFSGLQTKCSPKRYGPQAWMYRCQAEGYEQVFYYKQLFTAFRGLSFEGAVNSILNDAEQDFPSSFSLSVSDPAGLLKGDMPFYAVNGAFPGDILNLIASLSNSCWRLKLSGAQYVLEFFDPFNTYNGFTLTQSNRAMKWDEFEPQIDLDGVINTQSVRGAQAAVQTPETAFFRGDGESSKFDLPTKPFNNAASVVIFDSFNSSPINTGTWFESDIVGNYVYADDQGFVQYSQNANSWIGLISTGLVARTGQPMTTIDINWVQNGIAMLGFTQFNAVPADANQFLEAGVYIDATGKVFGVSNGVSLGDSGLVLATTSQYRFRVTCKSAGGCKIEYQAGTDIYSRNWTLLFDVDSGTHSSLGTAIMSYSAGISLAMVKTVYPYLGVTLEVDRGSGFFQEQVGIYPIDEDVDAVILEESVLAFFGSDPGPSTIPPAPTWQDDPDYNNIRVSYNRGVNIFATYRDSESIAAIQALFGGNDTGIREGAVLFDQSITSYAAALAKGKNEVDNRASIVAQVNAVSGYNMLTQAGLSLPNCGELARFSITLPTTNYAITRDIPVRRLKISGKKGLNDLTVEVEAGYLQRGLKTILDALSRNGQLVSISEDQVIYLGKSVTETVTLTEAVTSFGAGTTRRWGDSRLNRTFTVNTSTELLTTSSAALFVTGDDVKVSSDGTLPGGLSNSTVYYINKQSATTFFLYNSLANAIAGGATGKIDITSTGSGTHTLYQNCWNWGNHKWNSFVKDADLFGRGTLDAVARTYKRLVFSGEGTLNVRAKVNGV